MRAADVCDGHVPLLQRQGLLLTLPAAAAAVACRGGVQLHQARHFFPTQPLYLLLLGAVVVLLHLNEALPARAWGTALRLYSPAKQQRKQLKHHTTCGRRAGKNMHLASCDEQQQSSWQPTSKFTPRPNLCGLRSNKLDVCAFLAMLNFSLRPGNKTLPKVEPPLYFGWPPKSTRSSSDFIAIIRHHRKLPSCCQPCWPCFVCIKFWDNGFLLH